MDISSVDRTGDGAGGGGPQTGLTHAAVITVDRSPDSYLAATLTSARANARGGVRFDVFVGDERTAHLQACDPSVLGRVDGLPNWATDGMSVHHRHTLNYSRVLLHHGLVFEDDLVFCRDWDVWLARSLEECGGQRPDGRFVLALYSCYRWDESRPIVPYPAEAFYGTQAMYFAPRVRTAFHLHLLRNFGREPTDLLLNSFCDEQGVTLFACTRSLVQHVGRQSTGLGAFHRTENFRDA